jgi:hypothetical protein
MFGLLHPYDANLIKNKIILLTKFYIFRTKVNEGMVNFEALNNYLKENLILERNTFLSSHLFNSCHKSETL